MFTAIMALLVSSYQIFFGSSLTHQMDEFLNTEHFQGAVLVAQDGKIVLCKGYGLANAEHGISNMPDTVFRIASLTKQFTAVAILQLQEQGLLHVHDPVIKFLPQFPHGKEITIHHLLSHTSGLAEVTDLPNLKEIQRFPSTPAQVLAHFQDLPLQFSPGSHCSYCNSGYIVLGAIIEAVSGETYTDYLRKHVLASLNTPNTTYDDPHTLIPQRASGYVVQENGAMTHADFIDMSFPHASGGLLSNVYDLYAWNSALYSHQLLSPQSLTAMLSEQASDADGKITYGYGLRIGARNRGLEDIQEPVIGHFGSIEGFRSALIYYPQSSVTLVILSNVENTDIRHLQTTLSTILLHTSWR